MKKYLLLTLLGLPWFSFAQTPYHPFPDSNAVWIYGGYDFMCGPPTYFCGYIHYTVKGDTTIGSYTYKKILGTNYNSSVYNYSAAIRQDTAARKVYIKYAACNDIDTLLYDFSLQEEDTVNQCSGITGGCDYPPVVTVDSVFITNLWRKRINIMNCNNTQLIEGIGSTNGLLGSWNGWIGGNYFLACFSLNGISIYPDSSCSALGIKTINDFLKIKLIVFPNPILENASLQIYMPLPLSINVRLYDFKSGLSRNIFSGQFNAGIQNIQLNVLDYSPGLYVLQFSNDKDICINKLIEIIH